MTELRERSRPITSSTAARVVEFILPLSTATLPFGLVVADSIPSWSIDGLFILVALASALLVSISTRIAPTAVLLACVGAACVALTGRPNLFAITLIPLIAEVLKALDIVAVGRRFVIASTLLFAVVVGLYLTAGFNKGNDFLAWRSYSQQFLERQSLGFSHPNRAMMEWAVVAIGWLVLSGRRGRAAMLIPLVGVTAYLFASTDSRTSGVLVCAFIGMTLVFRRGLDGPAPPAVRRAVILLPVASAVGSFALVLASTNSFLSNLLTGRPQIYLELIEQYPVFAPFGSVDVENVIVDNGFINFVLSKGVLLTALYIVTLMVLLARPRRLSVRTISLAVVFLTLALFETVLLEFQLVFLLLVSLEVDRRAFAEPPIAHEGPDRLQRPGRSSSRDAIVTT